jgi:AbrB family looped-hinge helix DNA binding protein
VLASLRGIDTEAAAVACWESPYDAAELPPAARRRILNQVFALLHGHWLGLDLISPATDSLRSQRDVSMAAMTLTAKNQLTVPRRVRDYLGVGPGSEIMFTITPQGDVVLRPISDKLDRGSRVARARGSATVKMSTKEIMALTRCG